MQPVITSIGAFANRLLAFPWIILYVAAPLANRIFIPMIINGRFLAQRTTGVQRVAREIIRAENGIWPDDTNLLTPATLGLPESFEGFPVKTTNRFNGHAWEQLQLPHEAGKELLINLCNTAPMLRRNQLVVLHDAAVAALPENFTFAFRAWYQLMIRSYSRFARQIVTVSQFSADELMRHFAIPAKKIAIIPESGEHILRHAPDYSLHDKFGLEEDGYVLAVSSHAPNKNFAGVVHAMSCLSTSTSYKCVIVGGRNSKIFGNSNNASISGAIEVGFASDAQLRALYERAACFLYPSLYEGFGLPPLEAMSCGCPVLVSDAASLPEVCGKAAMYCNPNDYDDIARTLGTILESKSAREDLRIAGLARAMEWTWERTALELNRIINKLL